MNEDDLRAFDDEDAFAIRMDYEKYDENGFPSLLLGPNEETNIIEKEQQQQQQHELTAAIDDVFLPDAPELGGGADVHLPRFSDGDYVIFLSFAGALAVRVYTLDRTRERRRRG